MEEEEDEFGPLYSDVLKPFSSFNQTHNFNDQNPLNFNIQNTNLITKLKNIDGILLTGGEDCDTEDNLVFDVENEQKDEEMDCMVFNVEKRDHIELHVTGDLKINNGILLTEGDDGEIADNLVFDVETEQKEEEMNYRSIDVEKRDQNELHVIGDLMDEQIGNLEIDVGTDNLENNDGILYGEIADNLVFDVENEQKGEEMDSMVFNVEKRDHNELHVIGDLMDEQIGNLEIDVDIDNLELGEKIPRLFDSSFFDGLLENGENGVDLGNLNTNNNFGNGEGCDEDGESESEDGLNIILNDNLDDFDMEEELGNNSAEGVEGKKIKEIDEAEDGYEELGNDSDHLSHAMSKGVRPVSIPEIAPTDLRGTPVQVHPFRHAGNGHGTRLKYQLPYRKILKKIRGRTVFDIDIDNFDNKPWRRPGVDVSRFFNFGLDEEKWKDYCKQMVQLRLQISVQSKIISSESGRSKPADSGERVASIDNNLLKLCDSDAIIEIVFLESVNDTDLYKENFKRNTVHKNINGDGIRPFPLDGSCQHTPHEERGSQRLSNDGQVGRQMIDLKSTAIKRKDYHSYQDHCSNPAIYWSVHLDNLKERRMTDEFPQKKRLKYNERKPINSNKIRYDIESNYDVHFPERKRMKGWNLSDGDYLLAYPREFLDEPRARRKNNEEYGTDWNRLNYHHSVNCRDNRWRQGESNYRQRLKQSANVYDNQGGAIIGNRNFGLKINAFNMVHQNYQYRNNGNYKFSKAGASEQDISSPPIKDPPDYREKKVSDNQNLFTKQRYDVIYCEQIHEAERGHNELAEDSPNARESDMDERDNDLITEINDFVKEINDLVDSHNHVGGEMIKVEEDEEKLKEQSERFKQKEWIIKTKVDNKSMPPLHDDIIEETEIKKP